MGSIDEHSQQTVPIALLARRALAMSRQKMSDVTGISYATLRSWEDKNPALHKEPSGAARTLLQLCLGNPEAMKELLHKRTDTRQAA